MTIVFVTGTGTEVGKTWVTAAVLRELRARGIAAHGRKPAQSFAPGDPTTDAAELAAAGGEQPEVVCPPHRWLPTPMAPPMAAAALGLPPFTIADLVAEVAPGAGLALIEGAGGLRAPIAEDGDNLTLIEALDPAAVVLVADAGLGTINLTRLCCDAIGPDREVIVILNRFDAGDDLHRRNHEWLVTREGLGVVTDPEALAVRLAALGGAATTRR
ncbi:MAG: ATP-dependent dethiobiotin synthetase BioD [Actinomycetota bacterium]